MKRSKGGIVKKYAIGFLVIISFLLKYGSYMLKAFLSVFAGGVISSVIIEPIVSKYVVKQESEVVKDYSLEEINQYLELLAMRSLRELDKRSTDQATRNEAKKQLQELAAYHSGVLARVNKEYFNSDQEAEAFFLKHFIKVVF